MRESQELALSTQFPQQKATSTFFFAGLLENGHFLFPAFTFLTNPLTSAEAFLTQLLQQTLKVRTLSAFTALPENGHSSFTGATFLAANEKMETVIMAVSVRIFCKEMFMIWYYPREIRITSTNHSQFTRQWEEDPLHPQLVPVHS